MIIAIVTMLLHSFIKVDYIKSLQILEVTFLQANTLLLRTNI